MLTKRMTTDQAQTLIAEPNAAGMRLDAYLVKHADLSRTKLQEQIKTGRITLNGKTTKAHRLVHPGDEIVVRDATTAIHAEAKVTDSLQPTILFEDADVLVVNKPAGLLVHGGPGVHERTLADWAVAHDSAIAEVGDQPALRPGIVHRLDREASGVMVIAKTQEAFDHLKRQFQDHEVFKEYLALAYGRITDQAGRIDFAIARKPDKSGLMTARPKSTEGRDAETLFHVERYVKNMTLVRVRTLTGRTHQIRVHFKAIGHPLIGDPLYRVKRMKVQKLPPPRLFLHAQTLEFTQPHGKPRAGIRGAGFTDRGGQRRRFEAPLPADLAQFLARAG